jgi:hypothetical protein
VIIKVRSFIRLTYIFNDCIQGKRQILGNDNRFGEITECNTRISVTFQIVLLVSIMTCLMIGGCLCSHLMYYRVWLK